MDNVNINLFDGIPHNIFNNAIPKPFSFNEAPPMIANFAKAYSEATGHDHSGLIVAALIAAASVIDDRIKLEVQKGSNWAVSARLWGFCVANRVLVSRPFFVQQLIRLKCYIISSSKIGKNKIKHYL